MQPKHLIFLINPLHKAKARNRTPPCRGVSVTQEIKTGNRLNRADCRNIKLCAKKKPATPVRRWQARLKLD